VIEVSRGIEKEKLSIDSASPVLCPVDQSSRSFATNEGNAMMKRVSVANIGVFSFIMQKGDFVI
jgi:hypothetical protein